MSIALKAMEFARKVHAGQVRKYTGNPYVDHLAEVTGIAMSVGWRRAEVHPDTFMAVCWLHDCVEDVGVDPHAVFEQFGQTVMLGVLALSDLETGTRAERKAASRMRLAAAPAWVQTIKCADLISNLSSVVKHDPAFAVGYLEEKRLLLDVLTKADRSLWRIASGMASAGKDATP
jgi:guanosine-3',5'-bis(diphosphate) 3'-pyrophosphohydrolase